MLNATQPPRRMRFSFESRCRVVQFGIPEAVPQGREVLSDELAD
jgi:hypothetical protein